MRRLCSAGFLFVLGGIILLLVFLNLDHAAYLSVADTFLTRLGVVKTTSVAGAPEDVVPTTFTDLFSGYARLDEASTTAYLDMSETAVMLRPKFVWEPEPSSTAPANQAAGGSHVTCIGSACLRTDASHLVLNGQEITFPPSVTPAEVTSITAQVVGDRWVVGFVEKMSSQYEGSLYGFDGNRFTLIASGAAYHFYSSAPAEFGIGGDGDAWIALYGSVVGSADLFKGDGSHEDISQFFDMRAMAGGFTPAVVRQGDAWYVTNASFGTSRLIKLFENGAGSIEGAVDLTPLVLPGNQNRTVTAVPAGGSELSVTVRSEDGTVGVYRFTDEGFDTSRPVDVVSTNINNYHAEVRGATIRELDSTTGGGSIEFSVSNDGVAWKAAHVGETVVFDNPHGTQFFWRARMTPGTTTQRSPVIDRILLEYNVKFL